MLHEDAIHRIQKVAKSPAHASQVFQYTHGEEEGEREGGSKGGGGR